MSGIDEETGLTTVVISSWVYHYGHVCIGVCGCVGNGARNPAEEPYDCAE